MRGSLILCLLGAATSFVWEPRRLVLQTMTKQPPRWTHEEETSLRTFVGELGNDAWATIAARLGTGRTANGVEVKWRKLRAAGLAALPPSPQQVVAPPLDSLQPTATAPAPAADDLVPSDSDEEFMAPTVYARSSSV